MIPQSQPPINLRNPVWDKAERVHDWRNHVPENVQAVWSTFTDDQLMELYAWANGLATSEEWD